MFDSFLGRKFTAKCKNAIKCLKERLKLIRRRKQAMINFLKQDIAELLRGAYDSHALNRMDALIVEINHLDCYDTIEKFCECILKQLTLMQKQRECPSENMEAVSTLIFAAARFSDLPELCVLRHVFIERYGNSMEKHVNMEFVEKLASKSFSRASKVQLMLEIAQALSVKWDAKSLLHEMPDSVTDEPKSSDGVYEPSTDIVKDVMQETKDIHVIVTETEAARKISIHNGELENVNPHPADTSVPDHAELTKNEDHNLVQYGQRKDGSFGSTRARGVLHPIKEMISEEMRFKNETAGEDGDATCKLKWNNSNKRSNLAKPREGLQLDDTSKQTSGDPVFESYEKPYKTPPYVKRKAAKDEALSDGALAAKDTDFVVQDGKLGGQWKSQSNGTLHTPPYIKAKVSTLEQTFSPTDKRGSVVGDKPSSGGFGDQQSDDMERPKPISVRRKNQKSPVVQQDAEGTGARDEPVSVHHGRGGDASRKSMSTPETGYDSEEETIDRLLMHYSKKKSPHEAGGCREATRFRGADQVADDDGGHTPARAMSVQADPVSPTGGRTHPRLPDYKELAAKFAALKRN